MIGFIAQPTGMNLIAKHFTGWLCNIFCQTLPCVKHYYFFFLPVKIIYNFDFFHAHVCSWRREGRVCPIRVFLLAFFYVNLTNTFSHHLLCRFLLSERRRSGVRFKAMLCFSQESALRSSGVVPTPYFYGCLIVAWSG